MKARIFKEHDDFVPAVKKIAVDSGNDFVFINVDSHSDMSLFDKEINIGNFITFLVKEECFSKILWIKNSHNKDFDDGFFRFKFEESNGEEPSCDLEERFYLAEDSFSRPQEVIPVFGQKMNEVDFEVISENNLDESVFSQKKWLLSIDCDYFSSANPFSEQYSKLKAEIGEETINKIKSEYSKIKSYEDWIFFKKELVINKQWKIVKEFMGCLYDEYECTNEEIEEKIKKLIVFLKKNFRLEDCVGILICTSFFSGYVNKKKCPKIVSILETYLNNLKFFWEKA